MESEWTCAGCVSEELERDGKGMRTSCAMFPQVEFTKDYRELKLDNKLLDGIVIYKYIYNSGGI